MRGRPLPVVVGVAAAVFGLAACDPPGSGDAVSGCRSLVEQASREAEPADQVRRLDQAMVACGSYDAFTTELQRVSASIGYDPVTYTQRRCENVDDDAVRNGATCAAVVAPVTTPPPTTVVALLFVGDTVDGRPIEIRPSASIEFVGEVPAVIQQTVDIALEAGCSGVVEQRDLWAAQIDATPQGDIASVYAQHAQNVADFIQCETSPITVGDGGGDGASDDDASADAG